MKQAFHLLARSYEFRVRSKNPDYVCPKEIVFFGLMLKNRAENSL
jgi:hypothetical protein